MNADYSKLAEGYDANRIGYSADLYAVLAEAGFKADGKVLDIACGTGLASEPLAKAGAKITGVDSSEEMLEFARARMPEQTWQRGAAEHLEFADNTFDAVICGQAFHWLDRAKAMDEAVRVLKPGGVIAIWWKHLMSDDPVKILADRIARELGKEPVQGGLTGGFIEFYSAPLAGQALRVIPWRFASSVDRFIGSERSSRTLRNAFGGSTEAYLDRLKSALREERGSEDAMLSLGYLQFLYIGKKL